MRPKTVLRDLGFRSILKRHRQYARKFPRISEGIPKGEKIKLTKIPFFYKEILAGAAGKAYIGAAIRRYGLNKEAITFMRRFILKRKIAKDVQEANELIERDLIRMRKRTEKVGKQVALSLKRSTLGGFRVHDLKSLGQLAAVVDLLLFYLTGKLPK